MICSGHSQGGSGECSSTGDVMVLRRGRRAWSWEEGMLTGAKTCDALASHPSSSLVPAKSSEGLVIVGGGRSNMGEVAEV